MNIDPSERTSHSETGRQGGSSNRQSADRRVSEEERLSKLRQFAETQHRELDEIKSCVDMALDAVLLPTKSAKLENTYENLRYVIEEIRESLTLAQSKLTRVEKDCNAVLTQRSRLMKGNAVDEAIESGFLELIPKEKLTADVLLRRIEAGDTLFHRAAQEQLGEIPASLFTFENLSTRGWHGETVYHRAAAFGNLKHI